MNQQAKAAFNQYKELVTAWGRDVNMEAYENGCQLIQWINDHETGSDITTRQEVKAINWEVLLSVVPSTEITMEMIRRSNKNNNGGLAEISSDCPICPGCGQYMEIYQTGKHWACHCECIIGNEIAVPYQDSREEVIKVQNKAILKYQSLK
jgi:hypothetical protein